VNSNPRRRACLKLSSTHSGTQQTSGGTGTARELCYQHESSLVPGNLLLNLKNESIGNERCSQALGCQRERHSGRRRRTTDGGRLRPCILSLRTLHMGSNTSSSRPSLAPPPTCTYPGCSKPSWRSPSGSLSAFCSTAHRDAMARRLSKAPPAPTSSSRMCKVCLSIALSQVLSCSRAALRHAAGVCSNRWPRCV
jgi:hypothetical protein